MTDWTQEARKLMTEPYGQSFDDAVDQLATALAATYERGRAAAAQAAIPAGWKLVPVEPTEELRKRFGYHYYKSVVEAAPTPEATQ